MTAIITRSNIGGNINVGKMNNTIVYVKPNEAIQDVIDSITDASASKPYTIIVPPGSYSISTGITMQDYVSLVCHSPFGAIVTADTDTGTKILTMASNVTLEGFYLDCADKMPGITTNGESNIIIRNCHLNEWDSAVGWNISASTNVWIENCIATNGHGDDGFAVVDDGASVSSYVTIMNCLSYDNNLEQSGSMNGFEVEDGCHDVSFINCRAWNNQTGGIEVHSHTGEPVCYNIDIIGCTCSKIATWHTDDLFHRSINIIDCHANSFSLLDIDQSLISGVNEWMTFGDRETQLLLDVYSFKCDNIKNSKLDIISKARYVIAGDIGIWNCIMNFVVNGQTSATAIDIENATNCIINAVATRPASRPEELLTGTAASGQKDVAVADGSVFSLYQKVKISDDSTNEQNYITAIVGNTLTMQNNLTNTYTVAANAEVTTYSKVLALDASVDCTVNLICQGADYLISNNGSTGCSYIDNGKAYVATLSGNLVYHWIHGRTLILDPGGAARNITPAATANYWPTGWTVTIINTADEAETLTFDPDGLNQAVAQNERGIFVYSGSAWLKVFVG